MLMIRYGWCVQKLSKYQVVIKWIMNETLIWTPNSIYISWRVSKSSGPHEFVEILEVLSVDELMRAQLICGIVGQIWHAVWLILLPDYWLYLIVVRLSILLNVKYLKSRVSVNTPCTLSTYGLKNQWFESSLKKITRLVTAIKSLIFALFIFMQNDQTKPNWESFSFIMPFLWNTFSVSETHCDPDLLKLTQLYCCWFHCEDTESKR